MRFGERRGHPDADRARLLPRQPVPAVQAILQGAGLVERHQEVGLSPAGLPRVEDGHDCGVPAQLPDGEALAPEPAEGGRIEAPIDDLHGDITPERRLARAVHRCEPSAADLDGILDAGDAQVLSG